MKIAATVILFVAALFVVEGVSSRVSVGETLKSDFLNIDVPAQEASSVDNGEEAEVIEDWIDTVRRKRTRRQSRFC